MKTHFLSFGNGLKFLGSRVRLAAEAARMEAFDDIIVADGRFLRDDFWRERGRLVANYKRGYGLWSWKPYLILRRLEAIEDGDVLMYADVGCSLNREGRVRLAEYLECARDGRGWLAFSMSGNKVGQWTKRAMLRAYGQDDLETRARPQLASGIHFIRACAATRAFAARWYEACGRDAETNDELSADEHPEFVAHRHDQSAFSLLSLQGPVESIPDETWFEPDWDANLRYPVHARRWKHRLPWPTSWLRSPRWERILRRM